MMNARAPVTMRLESFEGPLDLLLYLIQSHELDISKVSIGRITDQYLAYVRLMQELNFDVASELLVMAATLLHWKSRAILPQEKTEGEAAGDEDAELTPEELIRQLLEHQRFRKAGEALGQLPLLGEDVFTRRNRRPPVEKVWREMDVTGLALAYQQILIRSRSRTSVLKKETVSLAEKIVDLGSRLTLGKLTEMNSLVADIKSRPEVVVTFLASLELARLRRLKVHQQGTYETIYVELIQTLEGLDLRMATGFDSLDLQTSGPAAASAGNTSSAGDGGGDFAFPAPLPPSPAGASLGAEAQHP